MAHRKIQKPGEEGRQYAVPQPLLFGGTLDTQTAEEQLRVRARQFDREKRLNLLLSQVRSREGFVGPGPLEKRIVKILDRVMEGDDAFRITLDAIAYARKRHSEEAIEYTRQRRSPDPDTALEARPPSDILGETVGFIEKCMDKGSLPVGKMEELLKVGLVFNSKTNAFSAEAIEEQKKWLNARDEGVEFPVRGELEDYLQAVGLQKVSSEGGDMSISRAPLKVLQAIYAKKMREPKSNERKAKLFLNTNDW
jgi:hypothetical protein